MNTFGSTGLQFPLYDPREVRANRTRFRRDLFPELDRANSYYSMSGRWPDVGWLLLDRSSYNQISQYSTNLQLNIQDFVNPQFTISNLAIVQARCVTRGLVADPNAIYLVQVTNSQGVLYNPWFQFPINVQYNVRVPAYDTQYYTWSMNGAAAWTWDQMVGNLWSLAPSQLGAYPHLPISPTGTPDGWIFVGVSLWEAINRVLDYLGLSVSGVYPNYTIVVPGSVDSTFTSLQTNYAKFLEDDLEYIDGGSGRVPGQVIVYFHRRNQVYGSEETVRSDAFNWQSTPAYSVTVPAPSQFASATGTGHIWVSQTVRYDQDENPVAADVTAANTTATERATQFYNTIFRGTQGFMRQVYGGVLPFTTGSLVDGVRWYNTGEDDSTGWRTEIIRGYIWEDATFPLTLQGLTGPT